MTASEQICQNLIAKMTNWQAHQWARAGFPGGTGRLNKDRCNPEALQRFLDMERRPSQRSAA